MEILDMILTIFLYVLIFQFCIISHELGHAIPALLFSKDTVYIILGSEERKIKNLSIGRLELKICRFSPLIGYAGWNRHKMNRVEMIISCAGGPLISLIIGIVFMIIGKSMGKSLMGQVLSISAYIHFFQFLCTAAPIRYPKYWGDYFGKYSDGYNVVSLMKGNK